MLNISWQLATPQYTQYQTQIAEYASTEASCAYLLQARVKNALTRFLQSKHYPNFLLFCAVDVNEHYALLKNYLQNNAANTQVIDAQFFNDNSLFGAVDGDAKEQKKIPGLLHQAQNGILILSLKQLLEQPENWQKLKTAITTQKLAWRQANAKQACVLPPAEDCQVKVILLGDRQTIAFLEEEEPSIHQISLFAEYEEEVTLNSKTISQYLRVIKGFAQGYDAKPLTYEAITPLLQAGARATEHQFQLPLCPLWFRALFAEASAQSATQQIEPIDLQNALKERYFRSAYLHERAMQDIVEEHVNIATQGKRIGQINALTLLEIPGHPLTYGEPARISCVAHFGDGEITDVERKAELAGNLHAKAMMIMQAYVHSALNLTEALPFTSSLVFEQSYFEVDGDSASVAKLCAFVSALALQPIKQNIAITGSVDQFGQVQAVGGINQKIEGFYALCSQRGLTGDQGVIIPKANVNALCLRADIVKAIKAKQFHLWAIENVEEAFLLLTGLSFRGEDAEKSNLLQKISERIDSFHQDNDDHISILVRLKDWLASFFGQSNQK